jgi:putative ATPase
MSLFNMNDKLKPLAERLKPQTLDDFYGQEEVLGEGKMLRRLILADKLTSLILYGPPGCGKTSLAGIIAKLTKSEFETLNAVTDGLKELREVIAAAKRRIEYNNIKTIVFIDEIHRFNKTQQDGLLPAVEKGHIILIGATTFNPFFYLVPALASRATIIELNPLDEKALNKILDNALSGKYLPEGIKGIELDAAARKFLITSSGGDSRKLLNALELGILSTPPDEEGSINITVYDAQEMIQKRTILYDRDADLHYDIISAFIKSMRGSDVNASLYYLARMLEAGEEVSFIARRCAIFAAEDVGLAEPFALTLAAAAYDLVEKIGMPESRLILSELVTFLAGSPKSNSTTTAIFKATEFINEGKALSVPVHLKDSHYKGAKKLGHGKGYLYPHDYPGKVVNQEYLAENLEFYTPGSNGKEKNIKEYLLWVEKIKDSGPK